MSDEEWRDIPGFSGTYEINQSGKVRRKGTNENVEIQGRGEPVVWLIKNGKRHWYLLNGLIDIAFSAPKKSISVPELNSYYRQLGWRPE